MPGELNQLPCPACGAHPELGGSQDGAELWVACGNLRKCRMAGPTRTTIAEAVDAWNALPRALEWTDEPPKVPGMYWNRSKNHTAEICVIRVSPLRVEQLALMGCADNEQWAGPIPEPREPK